MNLMLFSLGSYIVVDVFISTYHFLIDCFEYHDWYFDIRDSKRHHDNPRARGDDTTLALLNMSTQAFVAVMAGCNIFRYLAYAQFCWDVPKMLVLYALLYTSFLNHKYVHAPHSPLPFRVMRRAGLMVDARYHKRHHYPDDGTNFGFLLGCCDRPLCYLYQTVPVRYRILVPLTLLPLIAAVYSVTMWTPACIQ
jgi:hypothetical protein